MKQTKLFIDEGVGAAPSRPYQPRHAYELVAYRPGDSPLRARAFTEKQVASHVRKLGDRSKFCQVIRVATGEVVQEWKREDGDEWKRTV